MENEKLSLEERRYLVSISIGEALKHSILVSVAVIVILSIAIFASVAMFYDEISKYGQIIDVEQENETIRVFTPHSNANPFSNETIIVFYNIFRGLQYTSGLVTVILGGLLVWMAIRIRGDFKALPDLDKEYIRQAYLLNFEIQKPSGESGNERILNHLILVFPQLKKLQRKANKKGISIPYQVNQNISNYDFDIVVDLGNKGQLIVKIFDDKIKFDDIKELVKHLKKEAVFRLICVAKEYDAEFQKEEIENKMSQLDIDFNIDLVQEKEKGYSMVWVD